MGTMLLKDKKAMIQEIKNYVNSKPNRDVTTYCHVSKIGTRYIHVVDLSVGNVEKMEIEDFYTSFIYAF